MSMYQSKNKIAVAITGASGSIYAKVLLDKLLAVKDQWQSLAVVMSNNAKEVWQTELGNEDYKNYPVKFYEKNEFFSSICIRFGTIQYNDSCAL